MAAQGAARWHPPPVRALRAVSTSCAIGDNGASRRPAPSRQTGRRAAAKPLLPGGPVPGGGGGGCLRGRIGLPQCLRRPGPRSTRSWPPGGRPRRWRQARGASRRSWPSLTTRSLRRVGVWRTRRRPGFPPARGPHGLARPCGPRLWRNAPVTRNAAGPPCCPLGGRKRAESHGASPCSAGCVNAGARRSGGSLHSTQCGRYATP